MTERVSAGFAAFLSKELSCESSTCRWERVVEDDGKLSVFCPSCGSGYPWRDTYYLRRIYVLEPLGKMENKMAERVKMDGKAFRSLADYAVDQIAKFLDEHGDEFYPVMRISGKFGVVVVGIENGEPVEETKE